MKKLPKVVAVATGLAALVALGQAPAQADTQSVGKNVVALYDTGWG